MRLDETDKGYIAQLREGGVLKDDDGKKLHTPQGVIMVACSDGDQMADVFEHTCQLAESGGGKKRVHTLMNHGGAMLLSPRAPLYEDHAADEFLIRQINEARKMKKIDTVALVVHAPCGAANMADLSVIEVIDHMFRGKKQLKERWPNMKVACFVHVDFGDRKRMYFVSREAFGAWYEQWEMDNIDGMGDDFEQLSDLSPDAVKEIVCCQTDDTDIAAAMPDPDEDKTFNDPTTERLIRAMHESGQHTAVTPADLR